MKNILTYIAIGSAGYLAFALYQADGISAECKSDLFCYAKSQRPTATTYCHYEIEKQVIYGHRWNDGVFDPSLSIMSWYDSKRKSLTYHVAHLEVKSKKGNWLPINFRCSYDPETKKVIELEPIDM